MSRLAIIFFAFCDSYASWGEEGRRGRNAKFGRRGKGKVTPVATHQKERKDDTPNKDPPANLKGHGRAFVWRATSVNGRTPGLGCQHGDGGVNIGEVDEKRLQDEHVDPQVLHSNTKVLRVVVTSVDEVELQREMPDCVNDCRRG